MTVLCITCDGVGGLPDEPCEECGGLGELPRVARPTEADLAIAAEVIKAYRVAGNIWQAALPVAKFREALRQLADDLEAQSQADRESAEDFDRGAAWGREDAADHIRTALRGNRDVTPPGD